MGKLGTKHASAERSGKKSIEDANKLIKAEDHIIDIFRNLPDVAMILDENRQVVYCNEALVSLYPGLKSEGFLGLRPGEILKCVNSDKEPGGCGTSENCRYCGAVNAVIESSKKKEKVVRECRIVSFIEEEEVSFDFRVTASPTSIGGKDFTMVFMNDISDEKRRIAVERIFFHDIINTAGGIKGFTQFLTGVDDPDTMKEYIKIIDQLSVDLIDELQAQRALTLAENGDLKINISDAPANKVVEEVKNTVAYHLVAENKEIVSSNSSPDLTVKTDVMLLKRVLINMAKNALEATSERGQILIGCNNGDASVTFFVHNDQYMPRNIQLQLFMRSFSTKGNDRGLGTYSIKLLGEKYLKGKVWFETDELNGTTFFIQLRNLN